MKPIYGAKPVGVGQWRGIVTDTEGTEKGQTDHTYGDKHDAVMAAFRKFPPRIYEDA